MFDLNLAGKFVSDFLGKNAPVILTGVGVTGLVTSNVFSYRAGVLSQQKWQAEASAQLISTDEMKLSYKAKSSVKFWALPLSVVAVSGVAIVTAQSESTKRLAALAAVYALKDEKFKEYENKVRAMLGDKEAAKVKEDIARENVEKFDTRGNVIYLTGEGDALFFDEFSGRMFKSTMTMVETAFNKLNNRLNAGTFVELNELYRDLNLDLISMGDVAGWQSGNMVVPRYTAVIKDDKAIISIDYDIDPKQFDYGTGRY